MLDFPGDPVAMHFQNVRENFDREIHKLFEVQKFRLCPSLYLAINFRTRKQKWIV